MIAGDRTGHDSKVQARPYAGKEPVLWIKPGEPGRIVEQKMGLTSKNRNLISCKAVALDHGIGDLRPVWGKRKSVLRPRILDELLGFSVRKHFHVDRIRRHE